MTPISVIELMPSTSDQIKSFAEQVKDQILNGDYDFRKFLYQKKLIEKTFETISEDKELKEYFENEIEKFGKEGVAFNDLRFEIGSRKTWEYSNTGDTELFRLEEEKKMLEAKIKERQRLLQTSKKPFADVETGEIIYPAYYSEKTFIKSSQTKQ